MLFQSVKDGYNSNAIHVHRTIRSNFQLDKTGCLITEASQKFTLIPHYSQI